MDQKPVAHLGRTIVAGTIAGLVVSLSVIAFVALIFSGPLSAYAAQGVGFALLGAVLLALVTAIQSADAPIAIPQAKSAAIIALISAGLIHTLPPSEVTLANLIGVLILTTLLTGLTALLLGVFQVGDLIRSIPYPVVGAFFLSAGWLIVDGTFALSIGETTHITQIESLFTIQALGIWLPGLTLALLAISVIRITDNLLIVPVLLIGSLVIFYGLLQILNISIPDAQKMGWLSPSFSQPILPDVSHLSQIQPQVIGQHYLLLIAVILVSTLGQIFQTSAIEIATNRDLDINHELKNKGIANIVGGLAGSIVGAPSTHLSLLVHRLNASHRIVGFIVGAVCFITLIVGHHVLFYIPAFFIHGLLFFFGFNILLEWLYDVRHKLTRIDFGIVLLVLATVIVFGFIPGMILAIVSGIVFLLINNSKINPAKHELTGSALRSSVERGETQQQILREQGDKIYVARLQGFIYFSTANNLLTNLQERITTSRTPIHMIILDFKDVEGLDSTALIAFSKMRQFSAAQNIIFILSSLSDTLATQIEESAFDLEDTDHFGLFDTIDEALAWCEDQILETAHLPDEPFEDLLARYLPPHIAPESLLKYMERQYLGPNIPVIQQNDPADDVFFVEKGQVSIQMTLEDNNVVRLKTLGPGTIVGEVAMYLGFTRTASVVTTQPTTAFKLSRESMEKMERDEPAVATAFHKLMAAMLCVRLSDTNKIVQALLE